MIRVPMTERLGRYAIESEIGKGGMGVVYRARDERLGKIVALKVLSEPQSVSQDARNRLRHEARAAAVLTHPSIATAYDYDEQDGVPFIVYEYVEGKTLDRIIAEERLTPRRILDIANQIAAGLSYAHERGILHRDIKPQNIVVTSEGLVKILDFGLAKRTPLALLRADGGSLESTTVETAAGTIVGTVQYMSPEQIAGEVLDGRTDIFSLGIVLYEMASGQNPFQGQTFGSTVGKILTLEPPPLAGNSFRVPAELQEIVGKCLKKNREQRYASARLLREDLEKLRSALDAPQHGARILQPATSVVPRSAARTCLMLLQVLYLAIYGIAVFYHGDVFAAIVTGLSFFHDGYPSWGVSLSRFLTSALLVTGCCGIPVRLYLMASVGFDDPATGRQFHRMFPVLVLLDEIWALTPLLLAGKWPAGITLICTTLLAYLPFTHRNLIQSAYHESAP